MVDAKSRVSSALEEPDYSARDAVLAHPVATLIIDAGHHIAEANAAAEDLFNLARSSMVGVRLTDLIASPDVPLDRILEGEGKSFSAFDIAVRLGRGGDHIIDLLISPAHDRHGYRLVALPNGGDAAKGNALRPGSAARTAMGAAAMLAHEIKNPLSGIRGAAQLLENAQGEDIGRFSNLICKEVDRIAALIDTMQNFSVDQAPVLTLENIYPAINQAREVAKAGFATNIPIIEHYDPSLPEAMISHDGLVQILINLLKNASEALVNNNNPFITISTAYRHGLFYDCGDGRGRIALPVEICVSDNGPGVPPELVNDMFSPFVSGRTLGKGQSGNPSGQGLGLAMVDKLVREMGGLVRYQYDNAQSSTHFRLHLPVGRTEI